ncbi:MAG: CotH kinase family protein [Bacteroidota bacterium]
MKKNLTSLLLAFAPILLFAQANNFYSTDKIQEIRIEFEADNWKYLLDSLRFNGEELLNGTVSINGEVAMEDAGVRYRDGRSFTPNGKRNGIYIDLGENSIGDYKALDLSSALRDPSLVREVLASEIARTYFDAPQANYAKVFINDDYYGLFVNKEAVRSGYLKRVFGSESGALVMPQSDPSEIVPAGCNKKVYGSLQYEEANACNENNWVALQGDLGPISTLAGALASGNSSSIAKSLDVDAALWMLAYNNVLVNLNAYTGQYANNYYLYQTEDGMISPILGDLNLAFGSFKNTGEGASDLSTPALLTLNPSLHRGNEQRPLISALLSDDLYYKQYLANMRLILVEWVLSGKLENRAKALQTMLAEARQEDGGQYYTAVEFGQSLEETIGRRSRIPGLVAFMNRRASFLQGTEVYTLLPPEVSELEVEGRERFSSTQLDEFRIHAKINGYAKNVYLHYRLTGQKDFQVTSMLDDGNHYDKEAGDTIFGAVVKPNAGEQGIEYYIMVENAKTVSYSPTHYNFERYRTTLREVNK